MPLMVAVVFIHCSLTDEVSMPLVTTTELIFSSILASPAVPLFMFFAGYLFFINISDFTTTNYFSKLKSRLRTLLIPYIIWNLLVMVFFLLIHQFGHNLINPNFNNIASFSISQILDCFWRGAGGYPIAYQFWFIRDLILLVVLSPLVYLIVSPTWFKYTIGAITIIYTVIDNHTSDVIFYFVLGAACGVHKLNFIEICRKYYPALIIIAVLAFVGILKFQNVRILSKLFILSMSSCIVSFSFWQKNFLISDLARKWSSASFFLFGAHGVLALITCKILSSILPVGYQGLWILSYFMNVLFIIAISVSAFYLLKNCIPQITATLTGGR